MKIVVIGGSGLIGKKLVAILRQRGHEAVAAVNASPMWSKTATTSDQWQPGQKTKRWPWLLLSYARFWASFRFRLVSRS